MKKIMFNDKYGLTGSVLEKEKTQTRRVAKQIPSDFYDARLDDYLQYSRYQVGDVVAIAQSYSTIAYNRQGDRNSMLKYIEITKEYKSEFVPDKIWGNKMFTKAEYMPHHIEITGVRLEKLNDISEEDCLKEGICQHPIWKSDNDDREPWYDVSAYAEKYLSETGGKFKTAKEAYACLIDKIGKRGDWDSNPWVFVYDFILID